jgi:hypothetical protein
VESVKVVLYECERSFGMEFTPETMQDAALLVRFALNATKDVRGIDTVASSDGVFTGYVVLGKRKNSDGSVRP